MATDLALAVEYTHNHPQIDTLESVNESLGSTDYLFIRPEGGGRISMASVILSQTVDWGELRPLVDELRTIAASDVMVSTLEHSYTAPERELEEFEPSLASFKEFGTIIPRSDQIHVRVNVLLHRDTGDRSIAIEDRGRLPGDRLEQIRRVAREMIDLSRVDDVVTDEFSSHGFTHDDANTDTIAPLTVRTDPDGKPFFASRDTFYNSLFITSFDDALQRVGDVTIPTTEVIVRGRVTQFDELELMFADREAVSSRDRQNTLSYLYGALDADGVKREISRTTDNNRQVGVAVFSNGSFVGFRPTELMEIYYTP